ncbi:MAG: UDP-N-acetylmuramate--L-alanine ligase [Chloroflexi bacterium]|nr:MAG: UDP-N-acetylmuramate--L-alanine ligase [Chloroflexota bacterium]
MISVVTSPVKKATQKQGKMDFQLKQGMHIHLVGVGGAGISAIARVLLGRGFKVSGSDQQRNELTDALTAEGATIYIGHDRAHVAGADALVISSAVPADNPEVVAAQEAGIPVLKRASFLGHLMAEQIGIAVAGSHGKTTTTGMIAQILLAADLDPSVIVGGVLPSLGVNGRYGEGDFFVIEADEYDHMFLGLRPEVIVVTNIEHDHPDLFPTEADYLAAFRQFVSLLPEGGRLIACADDPGVRKLLRGLRVPGVEITTYSVGEGSQEPRPADFQAFDCRPNQLGGTDFVVEEAGQAIGLARIRVPGIHNVRNALAAIIVALDLGVDFPVVCQGLAEFGGMGRRFQIVGEVGGVTVIDDYAHHPTEIRATLAAAKERFPGRRLWAVWQPHTFSRTRLLQKEFANSFADADRVIALDIYRSREKESLGMDTAVVVAAMNHPHAIHIPGQEEAVQYLLDRIHPDDVVLTLSAGDGNQVGYQLLTKLRQRIEPRR